MFLGFKTGGKGAVILHAFVMAAILLSTLNKAENMHSSK